LQVFTTKFNILVQDSNKLDYRTCCGSRIQASILYIGLGIKSLLKHPST